MKRLPLLRLKTSFPLSLPACFVILVLTACPSTGPAAGTGTDSTEPAEMSAGVLQDEEPGTLMECLLKTAKDFVSALPEGSILGVINISSADRDEGDFAEEQLIFFLVQTGKFRIVERRDLDIIRREQNFHLSGEVDDETAVSIGRMAGAGIVITGTILPYGAGKYLNTRALDVETAHIRAVSSWFFSSLF